MSFFDILKGSLATLKANKLRTLLTMLGIIIGISSVIAMWAIGNGGYLYFRIHFDMLHGRIRL